MVHFEMQSQQDSHLSPNPKVATKPYCIAFQKRAKCWAGLRLSHIYVSRQGRGRYQLHLQKANLIHWTGADLSYSDTLLGLLSTYALSGRRLSTEALLKPEMYIEEITIEGFKSYAQRVIVPNFDPYFNAITGLNGSGKSNILDSICFVLGITNLSQVTPSGLPAARLSVNNPFLTRILVYASPPNAQTVHASCFQLAFPSRSVIAWANKAFWNDHIFHKKDCYCFIVMSVVQVRANSLQELVYKQGQAGITKASVSIVFNNQDKQNSPVGYEHFDQLTVTRQVGQMWTCCNSGARPSAVSICAFTENVCFFAVPSSVTIWDLLHAACDWRTE